MANEVKPLNHKQEVASAISDTTIADSILNNFSKLVGQEAIVCPIGYNYGNNLKLAYLRISQNGILQKVTAASVGEALVDMVLQGLDISKDQCYFIPYGTKLGLFRSYFGDISALESTGLVQPNTTKAIVVYEGDRIETEIVDDEEVLSVFEPIKNPFLRHNKAIVGAYAVTTLISGKKRYCFMSKEEIDKSWSKSKDPSRNTQKDFPQEMSKRTVIRRLGKVITKASKSMDGLTEQQRLAIFAYNKNTENQYINDSSEVGRKTTVTNSILPPKEDINDVLENDDSNVIVDDENVVTEIVEETGEVVENPTLLDE